MLAVTFFVIDTWMCVCVLYSVFIPLHKRVLFFLLPYLSFLQQFSPVLLLPCLRSPFFSIDECSSFDTWSLVCFVFISLREYSFFTFLIFLQYSYFIPPFSSPVFGSLYSIDESSSFSLSSYHHPSLQLLYSLPLFCLLYLLLLSYLVFIQHRYSPLCLRVSPSLLSSLHCFLAFSVTILYYWHSLHRQLTFSPSLQMFLLFHSCFNRSPCYG